MSFAPVYESSIQFYVWLTVVIIFSILTGIWLAVKSGEKYTLEDASAHAEEFGEIIGESHGPLTAFLIVSYIVVIVWTLVYLWVHWDEFVLLR